MNQPQLTAKINDYIALTRINRPIGIYLLAWPMLWSLWFAAKGLPSLLVLSVFLAGTVLTRSAGCVMNDFADRDFDGHVSRTANRPLATGAVTPKEALLLAFALTLLAFMLVLLMNTQTILYSVVAVILATIYPFAKRFTWWPQLFLGAAFAWAIPMAAVAQTGTTTATTWWLFAAALIWTLAYDTLYAMADRHDDIKIGIKSTAILFGRADVTIIGILYGLVIALLAYVGLREAMSVPYYFGLAIAVALMARHLWTVRHRDPQACFDAFLNNHYVGMVVFLGIALNFYWNGNANV